MTPSDAYAIVRWHYPGEFSFYDMDSDPDDYREFTAYQKWTPDTKFAVLTAEQKLVGFLEFVCHDQVVNVGLGLHPDWIGKGFGEEFVRSGLEFAQRRFKPRQFRLAVAAFNTRAIKVYEKIGFEITRTFMQKTNGSVFEFIEMTMIVPRI